MLKELLKSPLSLPEQTEKSPLSLPEQTDKLAHKLAHFARVIFARVMNEEGTKKWRVMARYATEPLSKGKKGKWCWSGVGQRRGRSAAVVGGTPDIRRHTGHHRAHPTYRAHPTCHC
ncbi:hypothetical protein AB6D20_027920 (plasmid) [Vibrio splendidus]